MYKQYKTSTDTPLLVSCQWLKDQLDAGAANNLIILDVSWSSSKDMEAEYKIGHISGARYTNVMIGENTEHFPRNIPTVEKFQESVRKAGVNNTSHVILYSDSDFCGYFMSGRAWWNFKHYGAKNVSILDGGLQKWKAEGFPVSTDEPQIETGDFMAELVDDLKRQYDHTVDDVKSNSRQICDSRAAAKFGGPDSGGRIAGAKSVPLDKLVDKESLTLKPIEEIKKEFSAAGIDLTKPITTYCFSGMSSCSLVLAVYLCGNTDASLFHGGFTEWNKRADKSLIEK